MLTPEEKELVVTGLYMRKNVIETGDHNLSAIDAERIHRAERSRGRTFSWENEHKSKVRALTVDQMKVIIAIDGLINKILREF
jgi:hypothetical protein